MPSIIQENNLKMSLYLAGKCVWCVLSHIAVRHNLMLFSAFKLQFVLQKHKRIHPLRDYVFPNRKRHFSIITRQIYCALTIFHFVVNIFARKKHLTHTLSLAKLRRMTNSNTSFLMYSSHVRLVCGIATIDLNTGMYKKPSRDLH